MQLEPRGVALADRTAAGGFEIEGAHAREIARSLRRALLHRDAELLEIVQVRHRHPLEYRGAVKKLDREGLPRVLSHAHAVAQHPAGLLQHAMGANELIAIGPHARGLGRSVHLGEHPRRHLVAERLEQFQLRRRREAHRGQVGVAEPAGGPRIEAVEQHAVFPLEVVRDGQRLAHAHVLELLETQVEQKRHRQATRYFLRNQLFSEKPLLHRRELVALGPILRLVFDAHIDDTGLVGLTLNADVGEIVHFDDVEVIASTVHRDIRAPVVLDAAKLHVAADDVVGDPVRAAAQRWLHRRARRVTFAPIMLRQGKQVADANQHAAASSGSRGDIEADLQLAHHGCANHRPQHHSNGGGCMGFELVEGELHVLRGNRHAIVPARLGANAKRDPRQVVGNGHAFRQAHVIRCGFVSGLLEQPIVDEIVTRTGRCDTGGRPALADQCIEAVVGTGGGEIHASTLGRVGTDPNEVFEVRRVFQSLRAEVRQAMMPLGAPAETGRQNDA